MHLVPFDAGCAAVVSGWVTTDAEALAWCSAPAAPVPPEVVAGWSAEPGVRALGGVVDGDLVAYGELWPDDEEGEVELARLVVAPARRGRGLGRRLVVLLTDRARALHPQVVVRVRPDNAVALRCYLGAGFVRVAPERSAAWNDGQPVAYTWLVAAG